MSRRHFPYEADRPVCPRCEVPIRRVLAVSGHFFAQCENKREVNGRYEKCGQHLHVVATDGICWVTELSVVEFKELREHIHTLSAREIYRMLGLFRNRERGEG